MFNVLLNAHAQEDLDNIKDKRTQKAIAKRLNDLRNNPEQLGKPLVGDLNKYHSVRAVGQRYRIIYDLRSYEGVVFVVVIGIRKEGDKKDVYEVARKRLGKKNWSKLMSLLYNNPSHQAIEWFTR